MNLVQETRRILDFARLTVQVRRRRPARIASKARKARNVRERHDPHRRSA